ncbi:MAG: ATP-binding protein [Candidatus Sumerlaeota bacterium]|nr:ATP-binding protein [Candidatus Sumerlaeota bacterium]
MINRDASDFVRKLAGQFPVVLILGPRQCGKTTLARHSITGSYFDLEKPSDYQFFSADIELALRQMKGKIILDEAQALPNIFSVLRSLVDEDRRRGRFYLLGSVSPELVRGISESLAGRVGIVELTPFLFDEVSRGRKMDLMKFWLRGGFPEACLAKSNERWRLWQQNYLRTFIERDIASRGLTMTPPEIRRLMGMIAHCHGGILNASTLGQSFGISYHTVENFLNILEGYFLVRRLQPYYMDLGKRLVKAPKLYIRDTGLLHSLLGIGDRMQLLQSPSRGASWEGFMIEQIIAWENLRRPGAGFYYFRTHAGAEIDLIVDHGQSRTGYEFKCSLSVAPHDWAHLKTGIEDGVIHQGRLVYLGDRAFPVTNQIEVIPAIDLLTNMDLLEDVRVAENQISEGKGIKHNQALKLALQRVTKKLSKN